MEIEVDYNPSPNTSFFISVSLSDKEAISFDYTTKAHRITKQILINKKSFPANKKISSEWDTLILKNRKFIKKYHIKWIDMGKKDWCNDEIWEIKNEKPISKKLTEKLLKYSLLISNNYKILHKFSEEIKNFEKILQKEIKNF